MGVPEAVLYTDETNALRWYAVGSACEPAPTLNAIVMANALINSAPLVAGITEWEDRTKLVKNTIYPISRLLVGKERADALNLLAGNMSKLRFALFQFRFNSLLGRLAERATGRRGSNMITAFGASMYDSMGLTYDLPDHSRAEHSAWW